MTAGQHEVRAESFRHEALLYEGIEEFVDLTASFIREAVDASEPVYAVVSAEKIERLRSAVGNEPDVRYADMADVGSNPARIIPAWRSFVEECEAERRPFRGIGEPIWAERTPAELVECERHEALLNLALADSRGWLLCPYDAGRLPEPVLEEASRNHPFLWSDLGHASSASVRSAEHIEAPFDEPLPEPPLETQLMSFGADDLHDVRAFVEERAVLAGLGRSRTADLLLAADEVVSNTLRHGGGRGEIRMWREVDTLLCEISDTGRIVDPLAGRRRPNGTEEQGYGLWLVNQVCDLAQIRTFPTGSVIRLHVRFAGD
ncbi:MAG: anti-sigma factor RsbA family regulatory protein [Actinomycetota bacterium]